jgi:hypothetical protein
MTTSRSFKKKQIKQGRKTVGGCLTMLNYGRRRKFEWLNKHDCEKSEWKHKPMKNMPKSRRTYESNSWRKWMSWEVEQT